MKKNLLKLFAYVSYGLMLLAATFGEDLFNLF